MRRRDELIKEADALETTAEMLKHLAQRKRGLAEAIADVEGETEEFPQSGEIVSITDFLK